MEFGDKVKGALKHFSDRNISQFIMLPVCTCANLIISSFLYSVVHLTTANWNGHISKYC